MRTACLFLVLAACSHTTQTWRSGELTVTTLRHAYNNSHLVQHADAAILVDAGYEADAPELADRVRRAGVEPATLAAVIISHGHGDHAGGARYFRDTFGTPVVAGRGDEALLAEGRFVDALCPTDRIAERRLESTQAEIWSPVEVDVWVDDELDLGDFAGIPGRVVRLPGHTEGSLVVVTGEAALVGDLVRGTVTGRAAATHFFMCDLEDNRGDVARLLTDLAPQATQVFTGHFGSVTKRSVAAWLGERP